MGGEGERTEGDRLCGGWGQMEKAGPQWERRSVAVQSRGTPHYLEVGALVPVLLHEPQLGLLAVHLIL